MYNKIRNQCKCTSSVLDSAVFSCLDVGLKSVKLHVMILRWNLPHVIINAIKTGKDLRSSISEYSKNGIYIIVYNGLEIGIVVSLFP